MPVEPMMTAAEIKQLRLSYGDTQVQFAARLECSPTNISKWETGFASPSKQMLKQLRRLQRKRRVPVAS